MEKYQIVALIGKSGAGKDSILNATCRAHPNVFHKIVNCTTRPAREGESEGVNYQYVSLEDFTRKVLSGDMLEATEFRNWFYGTTIDALDKNKINIGVFNPAGVEALLEDSRLSVMVICVEADNKERLQRSLNREKTPDCEEICRRFLADEKDFAAIEFGYSSIDNVDFGALDLLELHPGAFEDFDYMWSRLGNENSFASAAFWGKDKTKMPESANDKDNDE